MRESTLAVANGLRTLADSIEALVSSMQDGAKEVTLEDVRALLAAKKQEGKSVTELLNKFGASKLTDINPASYAAIFKYGSEL